MATVADVLVETLENIGVKNIFGIVGDSLNGITNAIQRRNKIKWIGTRHEEVAAFAAGAQALLTDELAVCAGSCGPGNLHLINGLFEAHRNHVPLLAIAAHIPSPEIGGSYFQETHPQFLFKECSLFCELVSDPEQMPRMLTMAIQTAISEKGVAVLVLPGDVALKNAAEKKPIYIPRPAHPYIIPSEEELKSIAEVLNQSKKITLLCGAGCRDAHSELLKLGDVLKSPMVHALRGKQYVEYDNPYDVGMTGLIGFASGYYALEDCDTLLILGSNFPYRQFYPTNSKIIQIDHAGVALGRRCAVDIGVIGNIKETINALLPFLKQHTDTKFLDKAVEHYKKSRISLNELATGKKGQDSIHPQYVAKLIDEKANVDTIFTCDVGTPTVWAARYLHMNGQRRLIGSFNHGSMANALAQAIGAQATYPDRQVVALCGDGGFSMLMGDILTLVQANLPIKIVIFNNGALGFVELEMKASGFLDFGTELKNPNFAAIANAVGIKGFRVQDPGDLASTLEDAFSYPGPALVDAVINRNELLLPPKLTAEQVKGFSLYLTKAILNGRGDEVYELLKSNIWR